MALSYSNIAIEIREISLQDRPEELYKVSKKGTVPVLITSDNVVIDESLDIILWALENNKSQVWISGKSSQEMDLITQNDTVFKKWLDKYKYHDQHPKNSKEYYREHCQKILLKYEEELKTNTYLLRKDISIADVAIFPFIRQFANVDYQWFENNYNHLDLWLKNLSSSDLFLSVMNKYETWEKEQKPLIINLN